MQIEIATFVYRELLFSFVIESFTLECTWVIMKILLKTIIIDDDKIATEQLKTELAKYSMLDICGNAYTGTEGRILW